MIEGGATFLSNFINRPSGGGKRVSRQHRAVPHPATLVSYFFNRPHRKNDFSFLGGIEIQAKIFRLYFHFGLNGEAIFFRAKAGQNLEIQAEFFRLYFNFWP